jgi:hypothetical protein
MFEVQGLCSIMYGYQDLQGPYPTFLRVSTICFQMQVGAIVYEDAEAAVFLGIRVQLVLVTRAA